MTGELTPQSILSPTPDMVWREIAGEMVLLDSNQNTIMGLNHTAGRMWSLLDGKQSLAAIAEAMASDHGKPAAEVIDDVMAFAQVLLIRGLATSEP